MRPRKQATIRARPERLRSCASPIGEPSWLSPSAMHCRGRPLKPFDRAGEDVAYPAHGFHQLRSLVLRLELLSEARDERIDRAINGRPVVALEKIHQLVARQNAPRLLHEEGKQIELGRRQLAQGAV